MNSLWEESVTCAGVEDFEGGHSFFTDSEMGLNWEQVLKGDIKLFTGYPGGG